MKKTIAIEAINHYAYEKGYNYDSNEGYPNYLVEYSIVSKEDHLEAVAHIGTNVYQRVVYYEVLSDVIIPAFYQAMAAQYFAQVNARSMSASLHLGENGEVYVRVATFHSDTMEDKIIGHMEYLALNLLYSELANCRLLSAGILPSKPYCRSSLAQKVEWLRKEYDFDEAAAEYKFACDDDDDDDDEDYDDDYDELADLS